MVHAEILWENVKECSVEDTNIGVGIVLKLMLRLDGKLWTCGLDLSGCEQAPVVCCGAYHDDLLDCIIWMSFVIGLTSVSF